MSKKGPQRKSKALSVSKSVNVNRKTRTWAVKTKAGPHNKNSAVPLGILLRDLIKMAGNMKEADNMLNAGHVKVDGVVRKEHGFAVGLFDIVSIPAQEKAYRVLVDKKGRMFTKEMEKDSGEKLCRVEKKIAVSKAIQLTTNDGRLFKGVEANVGDTLKIKVPENKVIMIIPMKAGSKVYITAGSHSGEKADVVETMPGTISRAKIAKLKEGDKEFETIMSNLFVIGEKKEEIEELK